MSSSAGGVLAPARRPATFSVLWHYASFDQAEVLPNFGVGTTISFGVMQLPDECDSPPAHLVGVPDRLTSRPMTWTSRPQ